MYSGKGEVQSRVAVLELGVCHNARQEVIESEYGGLIYIYVLAT